MALLGFERYVALRFLREGRMQSLLILVGVAAGVAVVTYISALIAGLQANTLQRTLGAQAHLSVRAPDAASVPALPRDAGAQVIEQSQPRLQRPRSIADWRALAALLEAMPEVAAVSPTVASAGLALRGEASRSVAITGVELERHDRIVKLRDKVVAGQARLGPDEVLIGRTLADDLGIHVGDRFTLVANGTQESVRVTALLDLGVRQLNERSVIAPLRMAQSLESLPGGATTLDLALADIWQAQALAERLARQLPGYELESWQEANAQLVTALNAQSVSTALIRGVVMIVVVLGIASVLVVSVVQKRREIGILRAMGATREQVLRVFLLQGAIVGAAGSVLGVVLAAGMIKAFTTFVRGSDGQPLFDISLEPRLALLIALLATACGVLAALAPARRAARLDPAQAIRL